MFYVAAGEGRNLASAAWPCSVIQRFLPSQMCESCLVFDCCLVVVEFLTTVFVILALVFSSHFEFITIDIVGCGIFRGGIFLRMITF
jgi:hypothetical protein